MNFRERSAYIVGDLPLGIMRLKPANIADPPDVIAYAVIVNVGPIHRAPSNLLA